jgi:antitoxin component of MazEF toxin-antitoxin module
MIKNKKQKNRSFIKKIFKSGNSKGIIIPNYFLNDLDLERNSIVKIYKEEDKIIIEKV